MLNEVLFTHDALTLRSVLETINSNENTIAPTVLSSFVTLTSKIFAQTLKNLRKKIIKKNAENASEKMKALKDSWK